MALIWHMKSAGTLRGMKTDTAETLVINGISGKALTKTPEQTVALVNQFLDIANIAIYADENVTYNLGNEVFDYE